MFPRMPIQQLTSDTHTDIHHLLHTHTHPLRIAFFAIDHFSISLSLSLSIAIDRSSTPAGLEARGVQRPAGAAGTDDGMATTAAEAKAAGAGGSGPRRAAGSSTGSGGSSGFLASASRDQLVKHLTEAAKKLKSFERANKELTERLKQHQLREEEEAQRRAKQQQEDEERRALSRQSSAEEDEEEHARQAGLLNDKLRMEVEEKERWEALATELKANVSELESALSHQAAQLEGEQEERDALRARREEDARSRLEYEAMIRKEMEVLKEDLAKYRAQATAPSVDGGNDGGDGGTNDNDNGATEAALHELHEENTMLKKSLQEAAREVVAKQAEMAASISGMEKMYEQRVNDAESKLVGARDEVATSVRRADEAEAALSALREKFDAVIQENEASAADLRAQIENMKRVQEQTQAEISAVRDATDAAEKELELRATSDAAAAAATAEAEAAKQRADAESSIVSALRAEKDELSEILEETKRSFAENATRKEAEHETALREKTSETERLQAEVHALRSAAEVHESTVKTLEDNALEFDRKVRELTDGMTKASSELSDVRAQSQSLMSELDESRSNASKREEELAGQLKSSQEETASLRSALEARNDGEAAEARTRQDELLEEIESLKDAKLRVEDALRDTTASKDSEVSRLTTTIAELEAESERRAKEVETEKERVKAGIVELKKRLDKSERQRQRESANAKGNASAVAERDTAVAELEQSRAELKELIEARDIALKNYEDYRVRAHALLKQKDEELADANAGRGLKEEFVAMETKLNAALDDKASVSRELESVRVERDAQIFELQGSIDELQVRCRDAHNQVDVLKTTSQASVSESQRKLLVQQAESEQRIARLVEEKDAQIEGMEKEKQGILSELKTVKELCRNAEGELSSFREMANAMLEAKDRELAKLFEKHRVDLEARSARQEYREQQQARAVAASSVPLPSSASNGTTVVVDDDGMSEPGASWCGEDTVKELEMRRVETEERLVDAHRKLDSMAMDMRELKTERELLMDQNKLLKSEMRKASDLDLAYLKNIIVRLLETNEKGALLPVLGKLLKLSDEEMKRCKGGEYTLSSLFGY